MSIRHKRKNSAGYTWQAGDLVEGQLGLNIADGTLHFKKANGTYVKVSDTTGFGSGTVTSVAGTGSVSGLTLSGTVTSSGNITLGGTLDLSSPPAIGGTTPAAGTFTTLTVNASNELRLADSDSSNYVGFKAPATVSSNKIWTLPAADGTNGQVLSTNGSGTLSWATAGGSSGATRIMLRSSGIDLPASANTVNSNAWTIVDGSSVSGLSVSGSDGTITLPSGTYLCIISVLWSDNISTTLKFRNLSDSSDIMSMTSSTFTVSTNSYRSIPEVSFRFTLGSSKNVGFVGSASSAVTFTNTYPNTTLTSGSGATSISQDKVLLTLYKLS